MLILAVIDLRPLVDQVIFPALSAILIPLAGAVGSWAVYKLGQAAHVQVTTGISQRVENALQNGVSFAIAQAQQAADAHAQLQSTSGLAATAANYVLPKIGTELKQLGIDPATIGQRLEARIADRLLAPIPGQAQPAPPAA